MGNLYQLYFKYKRNIGQTVEVNGPYDKWGYIVKDMQEKDSLSGYDLYLVRGTGNTPRDTY